MYLLINTAVKNKLIINLTDNKSVIDKIEKKITYHGSEKLLMYIDVLIKKQKVKLSNIKGIAVVTGPGSFTAIRIGVVVANTLAWSLGIPVIGFRINKEIDFNKFRNIKGYKSVSATYGKKPNITKSKKVC